MVGNCTPLTLSVSVPCDVSILTSLFILIIWSMYDIRRREIPEPLVLGGLAVATSVTFIVMYLNRIIEMTPYALHIYDDIYFVFPIIHIHLTKLMAFYIGLTILIWFGLFAGGILVGWPSVGAMYAFSDVLLVEIACPYTFHGAFYPFSVLTYLAILYALLMVAQMVYNLSSRERRSLLEGMSLGEKLWHVLIHVAVPVETLLKGRYWLWPIILGDPVFYLDVASPKLVAEEIRTLVDQGIISRNDYLWCVYLLPNIAFITIASIAAYLHPFPVLPPPAVAAK